MKAPSVLTVAAGLTTALSSSALAKRPNIILFMTDDQDWIMNSTTHQPRLMDMMGKKGVTFSNHYATVAQCCPSRASLLRGQAAHNTNITNVFPPGGNYDKWTLSEQDQNYLPHWLKAAGYRTEYIGKLLNGLSIFNYNPAPKGWDHVDALLDPYTYEYNNVVMSANGDRPLSYHGYHQSDVIRAKALDRLDFLMSLDQPFYLQLAPTSPHLQSQTNLPPIPPQRYYDAFPDLQAPRPPNFNTPDQSLQDRKPTWWKTLRLLNETEIATGDLHYRRRVQALQGIDDMLEDVLKRLEAGGQLDDTFVVYTTDNGFHIGQHRDLGGKTSPFREDTNLPFLVRGPGVPEGVSSTVPSTHTDLAPTFLEIAGLPRDQWPVFLDGTSLLGQWRNPGAAAASSDGAREILNVEYWGGSRLEAPPWVFEEGSRNNNSHKTLRVVNDDAGWLYSRWCTNDTELYNTTADPFELVNLADSPDPQVQRVKQRLNALLTITKSCAQKACRNPWTVMAPPAPFQAIETLAQALDPVYDDFFAAEFPRVVGFGECLMVQATWNEGPFYPPDSVALGAEHRVAVDEYDSPSFFVGDWLRVPNNTVLAGGWDQRNVGLEAIMEGARSLTDYELGVTNSTSAV